MKDPFKEYIFNSLCDAYSMLRVILNPYWNDNTKEEKQKCVKAFIDMCTNAVIYFAKY